jgi:site-specific DNA recombinase
MATLTASNIKNLPQFYAEADSDIKRSIIGSIFPEKWVFNGESHRTENMNEAVQLIYYINNKLRHKKTGLKISENFQSG